MINDEWCSSFVDAIGVIVILTTLEESIKKDIWKIAKASNVAEGFKIIESRKEQFGDKVAMIEKLHIDIRETAKIK